MRSSGRGTGRDETGRGRGPAALNNAVVFHERIAGRYTRFGPTGRQSVPLRWEADLKYITRMYFS